MTLHIAAIVTPTRDEVGVALGARHVTVRASRCVTVERRLAARTVVGWPGLDQLLPV